MSVTCEVSQFRGWLKALTMANTGKEGGERRNSFQTYHYNLLLFMSVTFPVSQFRGWLKDVARVNTGKRW